MPVALVIEPNTSIETPYEYIDASYDIVRCTSIQKAMYHLSRRHPDVVFLSASFSPNKAVSFLDALKTKSAEKLIPVLYVVDFSHKISTVLGTTWGNHIGILTSISSVKEYNSTIRRVMHS